MAEDSSFGRKHKDIAKYDIQKLKPFPHNPKEHTEEQIAVVAESIKKFGFQMPIVIDEEGLIICGHGRAEAAKVLGLTTVPVRQLIGFSESEKIALNIAENKSQMMTGFNSEFLELNLALLAEANFDTFGLGLDFDVLTLGGGKSKDADSKEYIQEAKEVYDAGMIKQIVLYFDGAEFASVIKEIEQIKAELKIDNNTDLFTYLVKFYQERK